MEFMLDKVKEATHVGSLEKFWFKGMLVAPSKAGKTQTALTCPGKKLLVDFDGRSETAAGWPNTHILELFDPNPAAPFAWDNAEKLRKELWARVKKGDFPYDTIIEDGLTAMNYFAMNSALLLDAKRGLGGAPAQQHWLPQIKYLRDHIKSMIQLPCNYVLTGHFDLEKDETDGGIRFLPKTTRSLRTEIPHWFNEVYRNYREITRGKTRYFIQTTGAGQYDFFGSTLNHLGAYWESPIEIDFSEEGPVGIVKLLCLRFGKEAIIRWYGEDALYERGKVAEPETPEGDGKESPVRVAGDEKASTQAGRKAG